MKYWLVKSEPYEYSYHDLIKDKKTMWDGIRNYAARNHLRGMSKGDLVLYYHSKKGLEVVGICEVIKTHYPDPTAEKGDWSAVDLAPVKPLHRPVSLKTIKATEQLQNMILVRVNRLSVSPVTTDEFNHILNLGETSL